MKLLATEKTAWGATYRDSLASCACHPSTGRIEWLLEAPDGGRLEASLLGLVAVGAFRDVPAARSAVMGLDAADYVVSVDPRTVDEADVFEILWTPVTGIINLMLDWDLSVLELPTLELSQWMGVDCAVVQRALARMGELGGVKVSAGPSDVRIALDVERCPLTAVPSCSAA